jgi:hypothetical protein
MHVAYLYHAAYYTQSTGLVVGNQLRLPVQTIQVI